MAPLSLLQLPMAWPTKMQGVGILAATLVGNVYSPAWYGPLFGKPWTKLMHEHRALEEKDFEKNFAKRWPYPIPYCCGVSLVTEFTKSVFFWHMFSTLEVDSYKDAVLASTGVFFVPIFCYCQHEFWEGKRLTHVVLNLLEELSCAVMFGFTTLAFKRM